MVEQPLSLALYSLFDYQVRFQRQIYWIIIDMFKGTTDHGFDHELTATKEFCGICDFFACVEETHGGWELNHANYQDT